LDVLDQGASLAQLLYGGSEALNRSIKPIRKQKINLMSDFQSVAPVARFVTPYRQYKNRQ
jgi:hypothetical protein